MKITEKFSLSLVYFEFNNSNPKCKFDTQEQEEYYFWDWSGNIYGGKGPSFYRYFYMGEKMGIEIQEST